MNADLHCAVMHGLSAWRRICLLQARHLANDIKLHNGIQPQTFIGKLPTYMEETHVLLHTPIISFKNNANSSGRQILTYLYYVCIIIYNLYKMN